MARPTLLLFPTAPEREACRTALAGRADVRVELCGFGPIAAAARAAGLIAAERPDRVVVAGIAGALDDAFDPAEARWARAVALDGVGAGEGAQLLGPAALGLPQWPGSGDAGPVDERLPLWTPPGAPAVDELLTVTAAAGDAAQAAHRRARFPRAAAEEMEAFGVAFACALAGLPCACLRAPSNRAGERAKEHWRIGPALAAVAAELERWLTHDA